MDVRDIILTRRAPKTGRMLLLFSDIPDEDHDFIRGLKTIAKLKALGSVLKAAPLTADVLRYVRNLGYATHRLDLFKGYNWPGMFKPYDHQRRTAKFVTRYPYCWVLNEMRTGKTSATLWAAHRLTQLGLAKKVLILSPRAVMASSWARELRVIDSTSDAYIAHDSIQALRNALKKAETGWFIVNHDKLSGAQLAIIEWKPDIVIVDESTEYRSSKAKRTTALFAVVAEARPTYLWALTGTPVPVGPMDVWGVGRLIAPKVVNKFMSHWRSRVMVNIKDHIYKPSKGSRALVEAALQPSIRVKASEAMDMPDMVFSDYMCETPPKVIKLLKKLRSVRTIDVDGETVDAANAAVLVMREMQLLSGVVTTIEGERVTVGADRRMVELEKIIASTEGKVIVLCPFVGTQSYIRDALISTLGEGSCVILNGTITSREQEQVINDFTFDPTVTVLVMHPKVGQYGLNLSVSSTSVWWVPTFSNLQYQQVNHRMVSPNKSTVHCIHLCSDKREEDYYNKLKSGRLTQEDILKEVQKYRRKP